MTSGAGERVPRLLALIPYLQTHPDIEIATAAMHFGVSVEQLREDLTLLWMCGLPGHGPGDLIDLSFDEDTVAVTFDAGMSRPLRLTTSEAVALIVALRTLAQTPGLVEQDVVSRALAKMEIAAGSHVQAAATVTLEVDGQRDTLRSLREALQAKQAVHLRYYAASRDQRSERTVDPVRLLLVDGHWYLEAWCRRAEGIRMFRLDRVDELTRLDEPARPPEHITPRDISGGLFLPAADDLAVGLRLSPRARWVVDYYPCEAVREDGEDLLVTVRTGETTWIRRLVAGLGGNATVLDPPELAERIRADARAALAAYG